ECASLRYLLVLAAATSGAHHGVTNCDELTVFFFQAEDGIRDFHVTGVQTCALPIYDLSRRYQRSSAHLHRHRRLREPDDPQAPRSEERRVGKECRSGGAPWH